MDPDPIVPIIAAVIALVATVTAAILRRKAARLSGARPVSAGEAATAPDEAAVAVTGTIQADGEPLDLGGVAVVWAVETVERRVQDRDGSSRTERRTGRRIVVPFLLADEDGATVRVDPDKMQVTGRPVQPATATAGGGAMAGVVAAASALSGTRSTWTALRPGDTVTVTGRVSDGRITRPGTVSHRSLDEQATSTRRGAAVAAVVAVLAAVTAFAAGIAVLS